jgi:hypothetical protein
MYFEKFPLLQYPVKDGNNFRYVFVRNLLRRVALSEDLMSAESVFMEYSVKDGERPEHIAERVYGDPAYHWLILLANNIIDPYHGWYMSGSALEEYIQKKYGGYSVYIGTTSDAFFYQSSVDSGATLTQGGNSMTILDYSPELCKLTVNGTTPSTGSATIGVSGGTEYTVKIQRVDPSYTAVHHFAIPYVSGLCGASTEFTVDPLSQQTGSYSVVGGVVGSAENEYPNLTTVGIGYSGSGVVDLWETYIGKYIGVSGAAVNTYAVSNYTYENTKNDAVRTIKVLHPRFKKTALTELESLLRI